MQVDLWRGNDEVGSYDEGSSDRLGGQPNSSDGRVRIG